MAGKRPAVMALALLLTVLFFPLAGYSIAQNQGKWSKPEFIYETEAAINYPYVVGDGTGVTHLFWREFDKDESDSDSDLQAIIYSNDIGGRWNPGRDIIVMKSVVAPAAAVDANGLIHLLWQSTNNTLYHSLATTESAHSAQGWAQPGNQFRNQFERSYTDRHRQCDACSVCRDRHNRRLLYSL